MSDIKTAATAYLDAWRRKDAGALQALLAPDVGFKGPMAQTQGRDAFMAAVTRMFPLLEDVVVRELLVEGETAVVIYDFVCAAPIGCCRTAELLSFAAGKISRSELFFDARPFAAFQAPPVAA